MVKAIIFDCFGVIITDAMSAMLDEVRENDPKKAERIMRYMEDVNNGSVELVEFRSRVASDMGMTLEEYTNKLMNGEGKNQALMRFIKSLRKKYKTAMLSNVARGGLESRFSEKELQDCFDVVVPSWEIGYNKPDPRAFKTTAERLGVNPEECIMIDDIESYCEGAKSVGMQAIQYKNFEQLKRELKSLI